jgi:hypothetical protein
VRIAAGVLAARLPDPASFDPISAEGLLLIVLLPPLPLPLLPLPLPLLLPHPHPLKNCSATNNSILSISTRIY